MRFPLCRSLSLTLVVGCGSSVQEPSGASSEPTGMEVSSTTGASTGPTTVFESRSAATTHTSASSTNGSATLGPNSTAASQAPAVTTGGSSIPAATDTRAASSSDHEASSASNDDATSSATSGPVSNATSSATGSPTTSSDATQAAALVAHTVFLAGDSTVSQYADTASETDQAGWGQMLSLYLDPLAKVDNRAIGGRTARRFIDEGALAKIGNELKPGDVLMLQFGTNDGNKSAMYDLNGQSIPYYLEPNTDFKAYLEQYIDLALAKEATPILVTPPPRNSAYCTGGNGTGAHAEAMRALGEERAVAVVDLNARSVEYLKAICPAPSPEDFFALRADGTVDGTHFQENGARLLASFVVAELVRLETRLADYVVER